MGVNVCKACDETFCRGKFKRPASFNTDIRSIFSRISSYLLKNITRLGG